jgi:ribosomal-protein-alanine N-acetyltransferase
MTGGIEAAGAADAPALAALHEAAFEAGERWDAAAIGVLLAMPGAFGLHIPGAGFVLARVAADEAEILTLAVIPTARRQGHAGALLAGAMAAALLRGAGTMFLEVSDRNAAARGLYAQAGFAEAGRRRRYYADGSDALVLRRALV